MGTAYTTELQPASARSYKSAATSVNELREAYHSVEAISANQVNRHSPLRELSQIELPKYFTLGKVSFSDLNLRMQVEKDDTTTISEARDVKVLFDKRNMGTLIQFLDKK
ncbi:hypothetical protein [Cellvibrio sp. pealriver]|uniref:hypothetical protein n=1 Tax=Cellvibrio sp. pealriver TaxID=1622269 RepID=UPI00066FF23B|nr:hypothetical protein [Cellvibrio sp. pealriver]